MSELAAPSLDAGAWTLPVSDPFWFCAATPYLISIYPPSVSPCQYGSMALINKERKRKDQRGVGERHRDFFLNFWATPWVPAPSRIGGLSTPSRAKTPYLLPIAGADRQAPCPTLST